MTDINVGDSMPIKFKVDRIDAMIIAIIPQTVIHFGRISDLNIEK